MATLNSKCCDSSCDTGNIWNRPGLDTITYRVGTFGDFKRTMLKAIASYPALNRLKTRADDDPTIALLDSWAVVLDVLSFYQERIANEGFIHTSKERFSILELARTIGYELNPGVAATTCCVFTLENVPGQEIETRIDPGVKVQSIPGQDEKPQTFETVETVIARDSYNKIRPRRIIKQNICRETTKLYLKGIAGEIKTGDRILFTGVERRNNPNSENWDVRTITYVREVPEMGYTEVGWIEELGHMSPAVEPALHPDVFLFRRKAALFGFNAPDIRFMSDEIKGEFGNVSETNWKDYEIGTVAECRIDLDAEYKEIIPGSWVLLDRPNYAELYRVQEAFTDSRTDYSLSSKVTSLIFDTNTHLSWFGLRNTTVYADSLKLTLADPPMEVPVFGKHIECDLFDPDMEEGRTLVIGGKPLESVVVKDRTRYYREGSGIIEEEKPPLELTALTGPLKQQLVSGQVLEVLLPPEGINNTIRWFLKTGDGFEGYLDAGEDELAGIIEEQDVPTFTPESDQGFLYEIIQVKSIDVSNVETTIIELEKPLKNVYTRDSAVLYGNVAKVTHGSSNTPQEDGEPIGSGDQSKPMQNFKLLQKPLTYVSAPVAGGALSTLQIRVDGIEWKEVPSLYGRKPDEKVYTTRITDDSTVIVMFGNGVFGARLPTGQDNIKAFYRIGTGIEGMVKAGQLSLLMTRPLGVKEVFNPLPASGAQDPETLEEARSNAPLTVLTMDRIVSVKDYEDFTRGFAGIGKAMASYLWSGEKKLVHITVAAAGGDPVDPESELFKNLTYAISTMRHKDQEIRIASYRERKFTLEADIMIDETYDPDAVLTNTKNSLIQAYSFAAMEFAQTVSLSSISEILHSVEGVVGVLFKNLDGNDPLTYTRIPATRAYWDAVQKIIHPAELVLIDETGITLLKGEVPL